MLASGKQKISKRTFVVVGVLGVLLLGCVALTYGFFWGSRNFFLATIQAEEEAMMPTLNPAERVIIDRSVYRQQEPERGDIISFIFSYSQISSEKVIYIKRVIATEGETVRITKGKVYVDNKKIREPYLNDEPDFSDFGPLKIPKDYVYIMGDNRANSPDSRHFGPVDKSNVLGKICYVYWPLSAVRSLKNPYANR